jgi:hypothetical protein
LIKVFPVGNNASGNSRNNKSKVMAKKQSNFSEESAAANPEAAAAAEAARGPSPEMLAMFAARTDINKKSLNRLNLPMMIKPTYIPVGGQICGKILGILDSPVSTIKGKLLHLDLAGKEVCFPVTGAIRSALAPGIKDDDIKLRGVLEKYIGKYILAERGPNKPSKFGRDLFTFEVYTSDKPL